MRIVLVLVREGVTETNGRGRKQASERIGRISRLNSIFAGCGTSAALTTNTKMVKLEQMVTGRDLSLHQRFTSFRYLQGPTPSPVARVVGVKCIRPSEH